MQIERDSGLCAAPESELIHELVRLKHAHTDLSLDRLERDCPELVVALVEAGVCREQVQELLR